jgi:hypothetical protein
LSQANRSWLHRIKNTPYADTPETVQTALNTVAKQATLEFLRLVQVQEGLTMSVLMSLKTTRSPRKLFDGQLDFSPESVMADEDKPLRRGIEDG